MGQGAGGAFILSDDYTPTGNWTFPGTVTVTGSLVDTGTTLASPVISGTVTGGASYTAITMTGATTIATGSTITDPAIVGATITGTVTIANGSTITTPVLSGTVTGMYTLGGTPTLASSAGVPYAAGVASGYKVARSAAPTAVTGTLDIDTGLAAVISVMVTASTDLDGDTFAGVSGIITGAAGHFTAKCWKNNADGDATMVAANAAKNINWIAVGT